MTEVNIRNRITAVGMIVLVSAMFVTGLIHGFGATVSFLVAVAALPAIRLRAGVKWPLVLVLSLSSCGTGLGVAESRAEKHANEFCERFQVGQKLEEAAHAASDEGDPRLRMNDSNSVSVGYPGSFVLSRHFCTITAEGGYIVKKGYAFLD
jgi:hypothetical protein